MAQGQPNVLFILVDDMGYGDFGVFGDGSPETPRLDAIAGEGVCLTQHYSGAPVCAPSRAALMTGRYPHRTGVVDTQDANGTDRLHPAEITIADWFANAGYATGLVGKWHLGSHDPVYHPSSRGFDEFVGFHGGYSRYFDFVVERGGSLESNGDLYMTDYLTGQAVEFIRRHADGPFFLELCYNAPHFPFEAPAELVRRFDRLGDVHEDLKTLYAMLLSMDRGLERCLEALDEQGIAENTIVVFTSDNGPQLSKNVDRYNANWAGSKGTVYEGGIRVPAVVRWPAAIEGGRALHDMFHFVDWLPTLSTLAGIKPPNGAAGSGGAGGGAGLDGTDLSAVLRGSVRDRPSADRPARFWQWNRYVLVPQCNAAVRDGEWKLVYPAIREALALSDADIEADHRAKDNPYTITDIVPPSYSRTVGPPHPPELYNIESDPRETTNLADREPGILARLRGSVETWFETVEAERKAKSQGYEL